MSEMWARAVVVAAALAAAGALALWQRARSRRARDVSPGGLPSGVYLFTSSSCVTCEPARRRVIEAVGEHGFEELSWESRPGLFAELGVDVVPALVIVTESGRARLHPGVPEKVVAALDP